MTLSLQEGQCSDWRGRRVGDDRVDANRQRRFTRRRDEDADAEFSERQHERDEPGRDEAESICGTTMRHMVRSHPAPPTPRPLRATAAPAARRRPARAPRPGEVARGRPARACRRSRTTRRAVPGDSTRDETHADQRAGDGEQHDHVTSADEAHALPCSCPRVAQHNPTPRQRRAEGRESQAVGDAPPEPSSTAVRIDRLSSRAARPQWQRPARWSRAQHAATPPIASRSATPWPLGCRPRRASRS